jgi:hypothetical protein
MGQITLPTGAASGTPTAGNVVIYSKTSDKKLYYKDETGTETQIGAGGGGGGTVVQQTLTPTQATTAINWASGDTIIITPVIANIVLATPTGATAGHTYTIIVVQDATGGWSYEFNNVTYSGGAPGQRQKTQLYYDGVDYI